MPQEVVSHSSELEDNVYVADCNPTHPSPHPVNIACRRERQFSEKRRKRMETKITEVECEWLYH